MGEGVLRAVPGPGRDEGPDDPLMRDLEGGALRRGRLRQGRTLKDVADRAQVFDMIATNGQMPLSPAARSLMHQAYYDAAKLLHDAYGEAVEV